MQNVSKNPYLYECTYVCIRPFCGMKEMSPVTLRIGGSQQDHIIYDIGDYDRYTISFNSFPAGVIGDMSNLAGLMIEVL